ncbi:MAG: hypothetical protein GY845_02090 [Planctomycetes bacterium]|nr:hypothetical protein [Planctomycetota bacterium]
MASVKGILSSGFIRDEPQYTNGTSYFPIIHVIGGQISLITNIAVHSVVKWFPSLFDVGLILLLYLLMRRIFGKETVALLCALLFACLQHHILFGSLFVRETIALVLAVCCVYLFFSARSSSHPLTYYMLSVVCLLETVVAHHLTSFMLATFLLAHFLVGKMSESSYLRKKYIGDDIVGEKVTGTYLLIAFGGMFIYWMYVVTYPLIDLVDITKNIFAFGDWGVDTYAEEASVSATTLRTVRSHVLVYGFYAFMCSFGVILIYHLWSRARNIRLETYSFTLYLFGLGLVGLGSLYLFPAKAYPDRFLMFGFLFAFGPIVVAILGARHVSLVRIGTLWLVVFMLFNVYMISPAFWNPTKYEGPPPPASEEEYALARTFDFCLQHPGYPVIAAHQNSQVAIYDVDHCVGELLYLADCPLTEDIDLRAYSWIIVQKELLALERKSYPEPRTDAVAEMANLVEQGSHDRNRVFESNNLSVFK